MTLKYAVKIIGFVGWAVLAYHDWIIGLCVLAIMFENNVSQDKAINL